MQIDNREYSEPELKSYIKGLLKRIADAENLNSELKKENESSQSTLGKSFDKVMKLKAECDEMESENERLKLMLKLAVNELEASMDRDEYDYCDTCKHKDEHPCHPSYNCYEWEYKEQALKLIGGESNEN